jgi:voltage-gated potassium channel
LGAGPADFPGHSPPQRRSNVFITLSACNLNPSIEIIARGDAVSTERKLLYAGADKVVLPTHIGAERIAEIILFPETSRFIRESDRMQELERTLRNLGLAIEVVVVPESGALTDLTVEDIEMRARRLFRRAAEPSRRRSHHRAEQGAARGLQVPYLSSGAAPR